MARCPECRGKIGWKPVLAGGGIVCPHCHTELEPRGRSNLLIMMAAAAIATFAEDGMSYFVGVKNSVVTVIALPLVYLALSSLLLRFRVKPGAVSIAPASRANRPPPLA